MKIIASPPLLRSFIGALFVFLSTTNLIAEGFDQIYGKVKADVTSASESEVTSMIKISMEEYQVEKALALLKEWLELNVPQNPEIFYHAGRAAELIAQYKDAQAKYYAYLQKSKPSDSFFNDAASRNAKILFDRINADVNLLKQYLVGHKSSNTWKYDQIYWQKITDYRKRSGPAVEMSFLISCIESGVPKKDLKEKYWHMFEFTASQYWERFNDARGRGKFIPVETLSHKLAEQCKFDPELSALFSWKSALYSFILKRNKEPDNKDIQLPLKEMEALLKVNPDYVSIISFESFHEWQWQGRRPAHQQEMKKKPESIIQKAYSKTTPYIQWTGYGHAKPKDLPYREDFAKLDKKFMASKNKMSLEDAIAIITSRDPKKVSYLRQVVGVTYKVGEIKWPGLRTDRPDNYDFRRYKDKQHPLRGPIKKAIESSFNADWMNPELINAWFSSMGGSGYHATTLDDAAFMNKIMAAKAFKKLPIGHRSKINYRFRQVQIDNESKRIGAEFNKITPESSPNEVSLAIVSAKAKAEESWLKPSQAPGMSVLLKLKKEVISNPMVYQPLLDYLSLFPNNTELRNLDHVFDAILSKKDYKLFYTSGYHLWQTLREIGHENRRYPQIVPVMDKLLKENPSVAAVLARSAIQIVKTDSNNKNYRNLRSKGMVVMNNILNKAEEAMGIVTIPVPKTDPAYPLFVSQQQQVMGNEGNAWKILTENSLQLIDSHRLLKPSYLLWSIEQLTKVSAQDEDLIELRSGLISKCDQWIVDQGPFTLGQQVMLTLYKGDIALSEEKSIQATATYNGILKNKIFLEEPTRFEAHLRLANLERKAKNFEQALTYIEELLKSEAPTFKIRGLLSKSRILFDKGDFEEAKDIIADIKAREPMNNDASILEGQIMIKENNFRPGYQVAIGDLNAQEWITTGEKLQITLNDPGLTSSGGGTIIEVDVWSSSGDRETVVLAQSGDAKHLFGGAIPVQLGIPAKGDSILQVVGDDTLQYAYNEQFAKRMKLDDLGVSPKIRIKSDAEISIASRPFLSPELQAAEDVRISKDLKDFKIDENRLNEEVYQKKLDAAIALARRIYYPPLKPGNSIYLRVIDEDRSRTQEVDEVVVNIRSSGGDSVNRVVLKETGTHTGVFDGSIPSSISQPGVIASKASTGKNPNSLISPKEYEAWTSVPLTDKSPVEVLVDLNDNIELGEMRIVTKDPSQQLKYVEVLTGMNRDELTPVAHFPDSSLTTKPLYPSLNLILQGESAVKWYDYMMNPEDLKAMRQYIESGRAKAGRFKHKSSAIDHVGTGFFPKQKAVNLSGPSTLMEKVDLKAWGLERNRHLPVISSFEANFYEKNAVQRTFRLKIIEKSPIKNEEIGKKDKKKKAPPKLALPYLHVLVNGEVIAKGNSGSLEGTITLEPGLHKFEILTAATTQEMHSGKRTLSLSYNNGQGGAMITCPDSIFDPEKLPAHAKGFRNMPANVERGNSELVVKFAKDSRARIIALKCRDAKGSQITINKIHLTQRGGKKLLPLDTDYQELAKNRTLEVLIGDRVQVVYNDDRFVGQKEPTSTKKYEKLLSVSYSDAQIGTIQERGKYDIHYRRFAYGTVLPIRVIDSDMNLTRERDKLTVQMKVTGQSKPIDITLEEAINTWYKHPGHFGKVQQGIFQGFVTPLKSIAAERARRKKEGVEAPLINPIEMPRGGSLTFTYRDAENRSPGIPIDRVTGIDHAVFEQPIVELGSIKTETVEIDTSRRGPGFLEDLTPAIPRIKVERGAGDRVNKVRKRRESNFVSSMKIPSFSYLDIKSTPKEGLNLYMGLKAQVSVKAPHMVLKAGAKVDVFLQSESTRKRFKSGELDNAPDEFSFGEEVIIDELENFGDHRSEDEIIEEPLPVQSDASKAIFNLDIPGTIRLSCENSIERLLRHQVQTISQYTFPPYKTLFTDGRKKPQDGYFAGEVLIRSGEVDMSWLDNAKQMNIRPPLFVTPKDTVHIGFRYHDEDGEEQWITGKTNVRADGFLDVMDKNYAMPSSNVFLGQRAYVRVADMGRDKSQDNDSTSVHISSKSGAKTYLKLSETEANSAVFKGSFFLTHAESSEAAQAMIADVANQKDGHYDVFRKGFPVTYGDTVRVRYKDSDGKIVPFQELRIAQGADGSVTPFTKQYSDSGMAMEAQFSMAEAYLELAKRHRKLAKDAKKNGRIEYAKKCLKSSDLGFKRAKDLLELAINSFNEPEAVAHAHYMLGLLIYEDANEVSSKTNLEKREDMFQAALQRFIKVAGTYGDTSYGSKAQFKKALTYEKLREPDIAAAEYVKLAYKYPDSEFLGTAMARLGFHFLRKGNALEKKFKSFVSVNGLKDVINGRHKPAEVELATWLDAQDMKKELEKEFYKSATILGKMIDRFPSHELATKCGLTAGHSFRKSNKRDKSVIIYKTISKNPGYDPDSRAEAMYWTGRIFLERKDMMQAYSTLMQITVDFPETKWAANARAELSKPALMELDKELELDRLK